MYKKVWYTCKLDVLLIKPIAFLPLSLPLPSSLLKLPTDRFRACQSCMTQRVGSE